MAFRGTDVRSLGFINGRYAVYGMRANQHNTPPAPLVKNPRQHPDEQSQRIRIFPRARFDEMSFPLPRFPFQALRIH